LYHFGRGHTNGDTFVVFPAARTMHAGDKFPRAHMPFIGRGRQQRQRGRIQRDAPERRIDHQERRHGRRRHTPSPVTWDDFRIYTEFYRDFLTAAQESMKKAMAADDFAKAYRVPDNYKGFRADPQQVTANARAIWEESKR
jgi:cyclase